MFYCSIIASVNNEVFSKYFVNSQAITSVFIPFFLIQVGCNQLAFEIGYTTLTWSCCMDSTKVIEIEGKLSSLPCKPTVHTKS